MKKIVLLISLFISLSIGSAWAQQYAFIDMEYILNRIPSFENANEQIDNLSKQWQGAIDKEVEIVNAMYKKYQSDLPLLKGEEKTKFRNYEINTLDLKVNFFYNRKN